MVRFTLRFLWTIGGMWLACCPTQAEEPKREQIGQVLGKSVHRDQVTREGRGTLADQVHEVLHRPVMKKYVQDHKADLEFTEEELTFAAHWLDERLVNEHNALLRSEAERKTAKKSVRSELNDIQTRLATDTLTGEPLKELLKQKDAAEKRFKDSRENLRTLMNVMPELFLTSPKLSRHLYEEYGGGRVLVSKRGLMAFDAYHRWLDERESLGEFAITDPRIREGVKQARLDDLASWERQPRRGTSFLSDKREYIQEVLNPPCLPKRKVDPGQKTRPAQQGAQADTDKSGD